jgi:hypothetical protein
MKWLLLILPLLPAAAMAQAVTPNFTTGTVNSTTTSTQTVAETINIKTYGGTQFSVTGSNVTPSGNLAATTTYTVTDATKDFSYSAVTLAAGIIGDPRHHKNYHHHFYHAIAICLLAVTPAIAEEPTTVVAAPQSSSTGSVTNQAVQINQGSYNNQSFGGGLTCSGPTMVFTPFVIGASTYHEATGNANYGFQMSISVPLDREAVSLCKAHARQKLSKERLDYELVRALKCAEFLKTGYVIHQESPAYVLCADVWLAPRSGSISRVSSGSASKAD